MKIFRLILRWFLSLFPKKVPFSVPFIESFLPRKSKPIIRPNLRNRKWTHHIIDKHGRKWDEIRSLSIKEGRAKAKRIVGTLNNSGKHSYGYQIILKGLG